MNESLTKIRFFTADNYEKEELFLTQMASKGWHFSGFAFIFYHFEKGQPRNDIYKLDFRKLQVEDKENYLQIHRDLGWENVYEFKVFNGVWEYFRRDGNLEISEKGLQEQQLFTDKESLIELLIRMRNFYFVLGAIFTAFALISVNNIIQNLRLETFTVVFTSLMLLAVIVLYVKIVWRLCLKLRLLRS